MRSEGVQGTTRGGTNIIGAPGCSPCNISRGKDTKRLAARADERCGVRVEGSQQEKKGKCLCEEVETFHRRGRLLGISSQKNGGSKVCRAMPVPGALLQGGGPQEK